MVGQNASTDSFCGQASQHAKILNEFPSIQRQLMHFESEWQDPEKVRAALEKDNTLTLPVVFHVVHNGGTENISVENIQKGLDHLNAAFRNQAPYNEDIGADVQIEFCLAQRNPQGGPTNGITRTPSSLTDLNMTSDDLPLKNLVGWDATRYINVYMVREICSANGCGVAGYATLPAAHGRTVDGIVMEARFMGTSPANSAVLVHEMGHYLGLYHTFEGGCSNTDCRQMGDRVCDTPPDQSTSRTPCDNPANSCTSDPDDSSSENPFRLPQDGGVGDVQDMIDNYMDYSDFSCYQQFTAGQKERMRFYTNTTRKSLLTSMACQSPCPNPVTVEIPDTDTTIFAGTDFTFTSNSVNVNQYRWYLDDSLFSSGPQPIFRFEAPGIYWVRLEGSNNNPDCLNRSDSIQVRVVCPTKAKFQYQQDSFNISFSTSLSLGESSRWTVRDANGEILFTGNEESYNYEVDSTGWYQICLEVQGNYCDDKLCKYVFFKKEREKCETPSVLKSFSPENTFFDAGPSHSVQSSDNSIYVVCFNGESILLSKFSNELSLIWTHEIETVGFQNPSYLRVYEGDNNNLYISYTKGLDFTLLKFDPFNFNLLWQKEYENGRRTRVFQLIYLEDRDEIVIAGAVNKCNGAGLFYINPSNGELNSVKSYELSGCTTFLGILRRNDTLFTVGRYALGIGSDHFRSGMTALDLDGNVLWNKVHFYDGQQTARNYNTRAILDGNNIVVTGYGSHGTTDLNQSTGIFYKTDFSGEILFSRSFYFPGADRFTLREVYPIDSGYLLSGSFKDAVSNNLQTFLLKTNSMGSIEWGKVLDPSSFNISVQGVSQLYQISNNQFFLSNASNSEITLLKFDIGDSSSLNSCGVFEEINVEERSINEDAFNIPMSTSSVSNFNPAELGYTVDEIPMEEEEFCGSVTHDLSLRILATECDTSAPYAARSTFELCNLSPSTFDDLLSYTVYQGNPTEDPAAQIIYHDSVSLQLPGDSCTEVQLPVLPFEELDGAFFVVLNADTAAVPTYSLEDNFPYHQYEECSYFNNIDSFSFQFEPLYLDLGPDVVLCEGAAHHLNAGSGFTSYKWSDLTRDSTYTTTEEGLHWVVATDSCGNTYSDTIRITYDPLTEIDLVDSLFLCPGDSIPLSADIGYDQYQWTPSSLVDCDTCASVIVSSDSSGTLGVTAQTSEGCISGDTVRIEIYPPFEQRDTAQICEGDSYSFIDTTLFQSGDYIHDAAPNSSCDSIYYLHLEVTDSINTLEKHRLCQGDSLLVDGVWRYRSDTLVTTHTASTGCDSTHTTIISQIPVDTQFVEESLCTGDSTMIMNRWYQAPDTITITDSSGECPQHTQYILLENPSYSISFSEQLCEGDSIMIAGTSISQEGQYSFNLSTIEGCDSTITVEVGYYALEPSVAFEFDCDEPSIMAKWTGDENIEIIWSTGDTGTMTEVPAFADSIYLDLHAPAGCSKAASIAVPALPEEQSIPSFPDREGVLDISMDQRIPLDSQIWDVHWQPEEWFDCPSCFRNSLNAVPDGGVVQIQLEHIASGCTFFREFQVHWTEIPSVYIPNIFSPNGDGVNDEWAPVPTERVVEFLEVEIYDRWGNLIRIWNNQRHISWDGRWKGKRAENGVYVYRIRYQVVSGQEKEVHGSFTLLR